MDSGACAGLYKLRDVPGPARCTHGPDPAPDGADPLEHQSSGELLDEAADVRIQQRPSGAAEQPLLKRRHQVRSRPGHKVGSRRVIRSTERQVSGSR